METSSEMNDVAIIPELPPKKEPVDGETEIVKPTETVEVDNCDKSAPSDKELSWEKIAAEFTEDEEDEVKGEIVQAENAQPETDPMAQQVLEETVIAEKNATDVESSEKTVEMTETEVPIAEAEPLIESPESAEAFSEPGATQETPTPPGSLGRDPPAEDDVRASAEEAVEITELKPEEALPVTEEVEYSVIEEVVEETNEIIEEHLAQSANSNETVVLINSDQSRTEITIEQVEESEKSEDSQPYSDEVYLVSNVDDPGLEESQPGEEEVPEIKPKKQRGRKPISDIPLHVLGRDITKPTEGVSNGGRTMPKPRLGVKVPYRNLTSQIVSKEEIEKEIMERFKMKQEHNVANSSDILFARKLTHRLAKKLIPSEKEKASPKAAEPTSSVSNPKQPTEAEIKNNSDLIAILEGEGDEIPVSKQKQEPPKEMNKATEKEIALRQLKELPISKPAKFFKSRSEEEAKPVKVAPPQVKSDSEKKPEVEPRLKTGMVIKTYTRKRKSTDLEAFLPLKKNVVVATTIKSEDGPPTNVYITKSSRVIKRKKIWDPDEVPSKSPIKSPKPETVPAKSPTKTPKVAETPEKSPKTPTPVKKAAKVPPSPPPKKLKQRLSEVDKLLMDEGAVNMLYDVKTNDDAQDKLKKKQNSKSVISLDKAHKELMSKTNVIKNDLQQNTTNKDLQKSLRKKEIPTPSPPKKEEKPAPKKETAAAVTRKKSKDSARSSLQSPPASPAYNAAEASRIIRRHSSSSFSSAADDGDDEGEERASKKKGESPRKKMKKSGETKATKEGTKNNNMTDEKTKEKESKEKSFAQYKSFITNKKNKLVAIKLGKVDDKHYFTDQVLRELTACLKELGKDDDCHVVSITSDSNDSFCHGLDYRHLVADDEASRKKKATELSNLVKDFLRCLLNFPKVLVAGIQGDCLGLGVTMLPLFDMVVASDTSTFSAKFGGIPEAGFLLTVPHLSSHGLASELFYTSQVVKADDAFRRGLVTRLCWPEKYHDELKTILQQVASQSLQSIMATKQQLRHHLLQSTEASLNGITKALVEHWTSPECQKNFLG